MARKKGRGKRIWSMLHDALFYDLRIEKLSLSAFRLLTELVMQFDGFNNGNLSAAEGSLRFKWNDRTLKNSKRELLNAELVEVTRQGIKRRPTLYALCHLPINEITKQSR